MHCRADAPRSNPTRAFLNFFSLKIEETWTFMNRNFKRLEKFHVRKVKCLVRATERKMSVWRMETSDDPSTTKTTKNTILWDGVISLVGCSIILFTLFCFSYPCSPLFFAIYSVQCTNRLLQCINYFSDLGLYLFDSSVCLF